MKMEKVLAHFRELRIIASEIEDTIAITMRLIDYILAKSALDARLLSGK